MSIGTVVAGEHRFAVHDETRPLYGGAVHYWRLDREKWSPILDEVKRMGFTMVSIYIPWEVHETARGEFDFSGNKDIDAFLTLIEEKGLDIVVRPGPQINSELTWFGYPLRILADPDLQALNAQGTPAVLTQVPRPIPAVSYAADKFFAETALWYDAICAILARHVAPTGGIVAAQVDNEMAYFFHVNAYAADYHPSSIANYRAFLAERHGDIASLNAAYGTDHASFDEVEPPRRFEATAPADVPRHTDWTAYRERYLVDSMSRLAKMMRERGLAVPLFHNYPHPLGPGGAASGFTAPFDLAGLEEKLDFVGFDVYSRKELYHHIKTVLSYVVGTSRFPYIPEFIAGVWPWYLNPGDIGDEEFVTKAALMQGIKGFSRYMLVERDRWLDSPIRRDGRVREDHAAMFRRANEVQLEHELKEVRRQADVLLLANRDYDRLEAASVLVSIPGDFLETPSGFSEYPTFMTVSESALGFEQPIQVAKADWFASAFDGLYASGIAFLLSDTGLPLERWGRYKAVVVSSFEFMSGDVQRKLVEFARGGGTVVLGPRVPTLDDRMQPDETLKRAIDAGERGLVVVESVDAALAALRDLPVLRFTRNDPRVDVAVHAADKDGTRRVVFVANPTADTIRAEVSLDPPVQWQRELWHDRPVNGDGTSLVEELPPYTVAIYDCQAQA
jgi:beta-galactosidase